MRLIDQPAADPYACSLVIVCVMSIAGVVHTAWLSSRLSARFRQPIDGGRTWRGARIFGDHKTLAGFMAIIPVAGAAFALLGAAREHMPAWVDAGLWALPPAALFVLGCWAGLCFMAGELPNSFLKRRMGIAPGAVAEPGGRRMLCLALDRLDSIVAMLLALSIAVPLDWRTWIGVLCIGPAVHLVFSSALFLAGVKARPA